MVKGVSAASGAERVTADRPLRPLAFLSLLLLGALWGAVEGMWLLGPGLVQIHRIIPTSPLHWLVLESTLLLVSAGLGTLLSLFGAFLVLGWPLVRRRPYRDPAWAAGLALAPLLPFGYVVATLLIEWRYFARLPIARDWRLAVGVGAYVAGSAALVVVYRRLTARDVHLPASRLASILTGAAALGAAALSLHIPVLVHATAVDGGPLVPAAGGPSTRSPLLVVGIDSANWETIRPLVARGALPTIGRLMANGIHGDIEGSGHPTGPPPPGRRS